MAEKSFRAQLPPWQENLAADDYVEYTWHAPTVRLYVSRPTLASPKPGFRYPDWCRYAMMGTPVFCCTSAMGAMSAASVRPAQNGLIFSLLSPM